MREMLTKALLLSVLVAALVTVALSSRQPSGGLTHDSDGPGSVSVRLVGWPRKISWDEFQVLKFRPLGKPTTAAAISSDFRVPDDTPLTPTRRGERWRFEVIVVEVRLFGSHSWVSEENRSDYVLAHEQSHFDITGIAAREWISRLKSIDAPTRAEAIEQARRSYKEIWEEMRIVQRLYDHATRYDREAQENWNDRLADLIRTGGPLPRPGELPGYSALGASMDPY